MKTFVVGDIHGEYGQLQRLMEKIPIEKDSAIIFLGDYIDRGFQSKEVVDFLLHIEKQNPCIFLKGNHEDMMLSKMSPYYTPAMFYLPGCWQWNGGTTTLQSYGIGDLKDMPDKHKHFFNNLKDYHENDNWYFVHAGLKSKPPEKETAEVLLWHRYYSTDEYKLPKNLIIGHSVVKGGVKIDRTPSGATLVNIDTGSGKGGFLSAIEISTLESWRA
jgi:serine/threonine protein phosphatase 1